MWGLLAIPSIIEMIISDFRSRTVRVLSLAVTCVLLAISAIIEYGMHATLLNMAANGLVCLLLVCSSVHTCPDTTVQAQCVPVVHDCFVSADTLFMVHLHSHSQK